MEINGLPKTKPARKRFALVLKRRTLAHTGPKRTAHLRHTFGVADAACPVRGDAGIGAADLIEIPPEHFGSSISQKYC
jgi:hypothetical protein